MRRTPSAIAGLEDGGRKTQPRITGSLEKPEKTHTWILP